MKRQMRVLSRSGDDVVATWDPKVKSEVDVAEVEFDRLARTMLPFSDTTPAEQLPYFKPDVDIIFAPQIAGG